MDLIVLCLMSMVLAAAGENTDDVFLMYADSNQGTVGTASLDGSQTEHCFPPNTFDDPYAITYDRESNTGYVVDYIVGSVCKFPLDGQASPELIYQDTSANPLALVLDGEEHIFITDAGNDKITRIHVNGTDPVDWVTGLRVSLGVAVDTIGRYLIWSDYAAGTISRASLDDPMSKGTVIMQSIDRTRGLHIDKTMEKLFWCTDRGRVLMANPDGSDIEVIVEIDNTDLQGMTGYGGHLYVTGIRGPNYRVFDIYNGSYTTIFNSTTPQLWSITVVSGQTLATACHVTCYNGGTFVENNRTCDCVHPWTGRECNNCNMTCDNGGAIDNTTCICDCLQQWMGDTCEYCNMTCDNGGTIDITTCTCNCLQPWIGDTCEYCNMTCDNGGTVDNTTCTCDCLQQWIGDTCEYCNMTCDNGGTIDNTSCTCDCLQQWIGDTCEFSLLQQSDPDYPKITSAWPNHGPAAGGTLITITGKNLPVEYNVSIIIGNITCGIEVQNTTTVIGITPGLPGNNTNLIGTPLPVSFTAYDTVIVNSSHYFTYRGNPVINSVHPTKSIIKGGTLLTVEGDNLESVAVILMEVTMVLKILITETPLAYNESKTIYTTECQVANETLMYCPTPKLDIPPRFRYESSQAKRDTSRQAEKSESMEKENIIESTVLIRMKRRTVKIEFSNDGDVLEFYIGFRLDGVQEYKNYSVIDVFTDPTFNGRSEDRIFKAGETLTFYGRDLDKGITSSDYNITVGIEDCVNIDLQSNSLSCYPPQSKPEVSMDGNDTEDPKIVIHVGKNYEHFTGYLRYPSDGILNNLPLHIIIPATVVPVVVIIVVIAALCAIKRSNRCCRQQTGDERSATTKAPQVSNELSVLADKQANASHDPEPRTNGAHSNDTITKPFGRQVSNPVRMENCIHPSDKTDPSAYGDYIQPYFPPDASENEDYIQPCDTYDNSSTEGYYQPNDKPSPSGKEDYINPYEIPEPSGRDDYIHSYVKPDVSGTVQ